MRPSLKLATFVSVLALAAACGDHHKSSSHRAPQQNAVCQGIDCLNSITWKLVLQGHMFPEKTRVEINDNTVLDECMSKQQYKIDRSSAPQSLTLENYIVPKRGQVKVAVYDQGWNCDKNEVFVKHEKADFEVVKSGLGDQILINL